MATIPSAIVVCSDDKVTLPLKAVYVIMRQIFQYGVKEISQKGDKICISLTYSPKATTLQRKFGNLPIRYIRTRIESEEDLELPEKALKRYRFNLHEDDVEAIEAGSSTGESFKKNLSIETASIILSHGDEDKENISPTKKN